VSVEAVKFLLKAGMDPDVPDKLGSTAIHHAAAIADRAFVDVLLEQGGDASRWGCSSLIAAPRLRMKHSSVAAVGRVLMLDPTKQNRASQITGSSANPADSKAGHSVSFAHDGIVRDALQIAEEYVKIILHPSYRRLLTSPET